MANAMKLLYRAAVFAALVGLGMLLAQESDAATGYVVIKCIDAKTEKKLKNVNATFTGSGVRKVKEVDGEIRLGPISPGHYKLECWKKGYQPYWIDVQVKKGTVTKKIRMRKLTAADKKRRHTLTLAFKDRYSKEALKQVKYKVTGPGDFSKSGKGQKFNAGGLKPGAYKLEAKCDGYKVLNKTIRIHAGSGVWHNGALYMDKVQNKAAAKHWVTFVFHDETTKASLNNIHYRLTGPGYKKSGIANNSVKLGPLEPGRYKVSFNKDGYFELNSGLEISSSRKIDVPLANRKDVTAVAPPKNFLALSALPEKGDTALYGSKVLIKGPGGSKSMTTSRNDPAVVFYDLKPGQYTYSISHPDYQPAKGTIDIAADSHETRIVRLRFQITPVTVRVRYENGIAARGVTVYADGTAGQIEAQTDQGGTARFNLATGTWQFRASAYKSMPASADNVQIPPEKSVELVLNFPRGSLEISILDAADSRRLAGVKVGITAARGHFSTTTNANGIAIFKNVPQTTYDCYLSNAGYVRKKEIVQLKTAATAQHTLKMDKEVFGLKVIVKDAGTRKPIAGANVYGKWYRRGNLYTGRGHDRDARVKTASDGTAKINATRTPALKVLTVGAHGYKSAHFQSVKVPGEKEVLLLPAASAGSDSADLEIKVLDAHTQKPLAGATVGLLVGYRYQYATTPADSGRVVFKDLKPGSYRYYVKKNGYGASNRTVRIDNSNPPPQTVRISAMATRFKVTILDTQGHPVADAGVSVKWFDPNFNRYRWETARSDRDGVALFYTVLPNTRAYVSAGKPGYDQAGQSLPISYRQQPGLLTLRLAAR